MSYTARAAAALVRNRFTFFDTVVGLVEEWPDDEWFARLQDGCGSALRKWRKDEETGELRQPFNLPVRLTLHQPSDNALRILQEIWTDACRVSRVDVTLDLAVADAADAAALGLFIKEHRVQRWHRGRRITLWGDLMYSGPMRSRGCSPAIYDDRLTKTADTPTPCVRIEDKIISSRSVRDVLGARRPTDLFDVSFRDYWEKGLVLEEVDLVKLGKQVTNRSNAKKPAPYNFDHRAGFQLCKWAQRRRVRRVDEKGNRVEDESVRCWAQCLRDVAGELGMRLDRILSRLDSSPFLPAAG